MPTARYALTDEIVFEGKGIHSGKPSSVRVAPNEKSRGIEFVFGKRVYGVSEASRDGSRRCTALVFPEGERVSVVEHLLSAIVGVGLGDVLIIPSGEEFPIMDGSSLPFARSLILKRSPEADENYERPALASPLYAGNGKSFIIALPKEEISVTYVIDYPGTAIGTELKEVDVTPERYLEELAPARTFCLESEIVSLTKAGLGLGGDADNALVMGGADAAKAGYRVNSECASHKAADLLGDLALAGFVPAARYICVRGGHSLHLKLVDLIKNSVLIKGSAD